MALFNKKKNEPPPKEMKQYITGAGGTIVSKSILEGTSKLKWLFREKQRIRQRLGCPGRHGYPGIC